MNNTQKNNVKKNSDAKIKANNKYNKSHYKNISIRLKPEEVEIIKNKAITLNLSLPQLILKSVIAYKSDQ